MTVSICFLYCFVFKEVTCTKDSVRAGPSFKYSKPGGRAAEVSWQVKANAIKPDNLSFNPRDSHGGRKGPLSPPCELCHTHAAPTHVHTKYINLKIMKKKQPGNSS